MDHHWSARGIERFAIDFAAAQRSILTTIDAASAKPDQRLIRQIAKGVHDLLESAFDNLPTPVRAEVDRMRTKLADPKPKKPPVRRVKRGD